MDSQKGQLPLPQEPGPSADGSARFLRKAINPDVSVKCLNFQILATYSKMLKTLQGQTNRWTVWI